MNPTPHGYRQCCSQLLALAGALLLALAVADSASGAGQPPAGESIPDAKPESRPVERSKLPWAKAGSTRALVARPQIASARELLVTLDNSQLDNFFDRKPLDASEDETLYRILYRWPNVAQHQIQRLAMRDVPWSALVDDPARHRIEIFKLSGRVKQVVRTELLPEMAKRLEFDHYYQVTMQLDDATNPVLLCARSIPQAWLNGEVLDERAGAYGLFLKVGDVSGDHPQFVFATSRVAWYPDRIDVAAGIDADQILLGELGFDWGLFEIVRNLNGRPLSPEEKEPFYQLLAAVSRADPHTLASQRSGTFDLAALLQKPGEQHGRLMRMRGTARAVKRVAISDLDLSERLGFDHYFEVDLFVSLGDQEVRLAKGAGDQTGPVYSVGFPVVCCITRLPDAWSKRTDILGNEELKEDVVIDGFHYKLYAYESEFRTRFAAEHESYKSGSGRRPLQPSPMFMAPTIQPMPPVTAAFPNAGWFVSGAILSIIAVAGGIIWWMNRSDEPLRAAMRERLTEIENGKSLNNLDLKVRDASPQEPRFGP